MKDWEDIIKERMAGRKAELPESDWNDFLSKKAAHEHAAGKRRRALAASISIPAAAAVLLLLLIPFDTDVPDNQLSKNELSEELDVTVNAVVAKVAMANDSIMINYDSYKLSEGVSMESLICNLPGVLIDSSGMVTVNGKALSGLNVFDKNFLGQDKHDELIQHTAEILEKDKTDKTQSNLSHQTDFDDGQDEISVFIYFADTIYMPDSLFYINGVVRLPMKYRKLKTMKDYLLKLPGVKVTDDGNVIVNDQKVNRIFFKRMKRIVFHCSHKYSVVYLPFSAKHM